MQFFQWMNGVGDSSIWHSPRIPSLSRAISGRTLPCVGSAAGVWSWCAESSSPALPPTPANWAECRWWTCWTNMGMLCYWMDHSIGCPHQGTWYWDSPVVPSAGVATASPLRYLWFSSHVCSGQSWWLKGNTREFVNNTWKVKGCTQVIAIFWSVIYK